MSFFHLTKLKPPVKAARVATGKVSQLKPTQQAAETLHKLGCQACPLNKADIRTPKMGPTVAKRTDILFLAEAPGRHEDESSGKPLTGPSGRLIRECIPDAANCSFDNVCNCRPPENRTPVWKEIECCRPRRIKVIEELKPKVIVGLGAIPSQFALGTADISGLRGRVFVVRVGSHTCYYLPTFHPSYVLRNAYDKKRALNSKLGHCLRMDVGRAFHALVDLPDSPRVFDANDCRNDLMVFMGNSDSELPQLIELLRRAKDAPVKAVDIETTTLRPYSANSSILSAAISYDGTSFAFALGHPQAKWGASRTRYGGAIAEILQAFVDLLADDTLKVAHNAPFEVEWLSYFHGRELARHGIWEDTMMQAHFLDERKGDFRDEESSASRYLGLGFLTFQHFGVDIKKAFKVNRRNIGRSELTELLTYNAADARFTFMLWQHQNKLLKRRGLYDAYQEALPRQVTVALMQSIGVDVNESERAVQKESLTGQIEGIRFNIQSEGVVAEYRNGQGEFNPLSNDHVLRIFRDYLHRTELAVEVAPGKVRNSVDKNVLDKIDHPLAGYILELRNKTKLLSTYVEGLPVFPDGKLHTSFNTCITETGRLSSDSPNLQNFPKRADVWVRKQVIPPPGNLLVAIDYGQLEACAGAMCSKDKYLVEALWKDYDMHMEWAERIAAACPGISDMDDKAERKRFRSIIKNKFVFPLFYGASNDSVHGYILNGTGYNIPERVLGRLVDEFWGTLQGFKAWQDATVSKYYEVGYAETLCGRRHHYPLTRNQVINHPIQGTAAELVVDAMNRLSLMSIDTGAMHLHPVLNIHDDLTFVVPDNSQFDDAVDTIVKEMLTFAYKWVNVPLSCEVSVGKNWGELEEIGKFWSHKDI